MSRRALATGLVAALALGCSKKPVPEDRFRIPNATQQAYADPGVDAMPGMDNNITLTADEIRGRNTWMLWTAGNEMFWDWLSRHGYGTVDFVKLIDTRTRGTRFARLGLMNDPNLTQATHADSLGVWLDSVVTPEPKEIDPRVYGRPTGIMGLRYYPNPNFNAAARAKWDTARFYGKTDAAYWTDTALVRPYVVGMACGFCHVGPHPLNPPTDVEHPKFENMSTTIGAQYFRTAPIFAPAQDATSFVFQLLSGYREGTLDTSLIATDQIFNPGTMNALFEIGGRLGAATPDSMGPNNHSVPGLAALTPAGTPAVPHILKDGADNVGIIGALSRVFVNIGEHWQQWIMRHDAIVGIRMDQGVFSIDTAKAKSDYWNATEARLGYMAQYFVTEAKAYHLEKAPGGNAFLAPDAALVPRGKVVFADECAECHSSKQPPQAVKGGAARQEWYRASVASKDFLDGNYLSTDRRIKVSEKDLRTNACRALATNAVRGHVWDNFSSETYKGSAPADSYKVFLPYRDALKTDSVTVRFPGGGPGYYRPASLVSMWATAPFLHNNALGIVTHDPSVPGRMKAFDDAIERLLLIKPRLDTLSIYRTTEVSNIEIPVVGLPGWITAIVPSENGKIKVGPIPRGTPVGLLGSARLSPSAPVGEKLSNLTMAVKAIGDFKKIRTDGMSNDEARALLRSLVPALVGVSNCPDLVEDQGHYYGTQLSLADKRALIAFLKRL